jgi:N6-L-threonylcarbamoyladenine synthase
MKILAIDTSCDETSVAVTENTTVLSNIIWSQASQHAKWGGVFPSLAQRLHRERIDWTINQALKRANVNISDIDSIAVTQGPGLAIALEVGITKAKELATKYRKPLIAINHIEGHALSPLANKTNFLYKFPILGLVVSGSHTDLILIKKIGQYKVIARTQDDALGEALDKAARMLDLGYPGGEILEKMAKMGNSNMYVLPTPMVGREKEMKFSYSGLKTAMYRLVEKEKPLTKSKIENLANVFQDKAFTHLTRLVEGYLINSEIRNTTIFVGGGVSNNLELRNRLRKIGKLYGTTIEFPYSKSLCGDNAAMIGIVAYFKQLKKAFVRDIQKLDRKPQLEIS